MNNSLSTIKAQSTQRIILLALCLLCISTARGQVNEETTAEHPLQKIVTNTKAIGIGYSSMQDTYLSPEHYAGMELRYLSHTLRENGRSPFTHKSGNGDWTRLIINEGYISQGKSRSQSGATIDGAYHFQYGILHRKHLLADRLTIHSGSALESLFGFLYNTRNGNNPAQVRALVNWGLVTHADYAIDSSRKRYISYEASVPLIGVTFSPNYGQSYYEISEGHYDRNIVPTTVVCSPSLSHTVTYSFPLWGKTLSVGYLGDYRQQAVNNIRQHVYSHNIIIGIKNL